MGTTSLEIFGLIVAAVIGGLFTGLWAYRKNSADAAGVLVKSAVDMLDKKDKDLKTCVEEKDAITAKIEALEVRIDSAEKRALAAEAQVQGVNSVVAELVKRFDEISEERTELVKIVSALETQIESLGYTPKTKTSVKQKRKGDSQNGSKT